MIKGHFQIFKKSAVRTVMPVMTASEGVGFSLPPKRLIINTGIGFHPPIDAASKIKDQNILAAERRF